MNALTALPYWVDHINRVTSAVPPVHLPSHHGASVGSSHGASAGSSSGGSGSGTSASTNITTTNNASSNTGSNSASTASGSTSGHPPPFTLETLPEYSIYLSKLTKLLDQLDRVNSGTWTPITTIYNNSTPPTLPHSSSMSTGIAIPCHIVYLSKLTKLFDQLDRVNSAYNRHRVRVELSLIASGHGHGQGQGVHLPASARTLIEGSLIEESHIVFTTLGSAGHPCMESTAFVVCVVDEAAQCCEPSTLIALRR